MQCAVHTLDRISWPETGCHLIRVAQVRHVARATRHHPVVDGWEEAEDYWRWTMSGVGRSRSRRKKKTESAAPPEPTTSTLWASPDGPGLLARHTCMWETRHTAQENDGGWPRTDRSPLAAAVADALDAYDVIVLLPRYWSWRPHGPARLPPPALSHCCIGVVLAARQGRSPHAAPADGRCQTGAAVPVTCFQVVKRSVIPVRYRAEVRRWRRGRKWG